MIIDTPTIIGSFTLQTIAVSSNCELNYSHHTILASNTIDIILPTAVGVLGREYNIINVGTGVITIKTTSSQTINGESTLIISDQWSSVVLISDGSNWVRGS